MFSSFAVACHTDNIGPGSTFVAIPGTRYDGVSYIHTALARGATRIVVQDSAVLSEQVVQEIADRNVVLERTSNARKALADYSAAAYDYPARKLTIVGITGTKGKSTTAALLFHILNTTGQRAALVSTIEHRIGDMRIPATLTTPQPDFLHHFLYQCVEQNVAVVVMEAAAQAETLHRLDGIVFDSFVFTNFAHEHLEFYGSLEEYFEDKKRLMLRTKLQGTVVLGCDHPWMRALVDDTRWSWVTVSDHDADALVYVTHRASSLDHGVISSGSYGDQEHTLNCPALLGSYNALNIWYAALAAHISGVSWSAIDHALQKAPALAGRLQKIQLSMGGLCIVDYAHNPSSYEAVLSAVRPLTDHLIVVFGAGGERDRHKRPLMGTVAAAYADVIILTADNPRSESVSEIIADIQGGISEGPELIVEPDRAEAIRRGAQLCDASSVMMLLGKGPDEYQIIGQYTYHFSDAEIAQSL